MTRRTHVRSKQMALCVRLSVCSADLRSDDRSLHADRSALRYRESDTIRKVL